MDLIKYSRGHFFGTLLPGSFFIINLLIIKPDFIKGFDLISVLSTGQHDFGLFTILFIASYVIGVGLRLLSPDIIDSLSLIVRIPILGFKYLYFYFLKNDKGFSFKENFNNLNQSFPYSKFLFNNFLPTTSPMHKIFFGTILTRDFDNDYKKFTKDHINHYKIYIYAKSPSLSEEVMYGEGLVRFVSGIIYSLLFVLIIIGFKFYDFKYLFWFYIFILTIFLYRLRNIRIKEILSVLDGFMYLN